MKAPKNPKASFDFCKGDEVYATLSSGKKEFGTIIRMIKTERKAIVQLKNQKKKLKVSIKNLEPDTDIEESEDIEGGLFDEPDDFEAEGFTQYDVQWDDDLINFKLKNEVGIFYGWLRRISGKSHAVDLYTQFKGKSYNCETIFYVDDPRDDLDSLNADICAAVNKWFYYKCRGDYDTLHTLELKANKPVITITSMETIDKILLGLRNYRDTALGSGGLYTYMFTGDKENDPSMRIVLNLAQQAKALQGRVPSLYTGSLLDVSSDIQALPRKKDRQKRMAENGNVFKGNIEELVTKLKETKDKSQQRKLRAILRKMGHSGGCRSTNKKK